jgi:hypothetical protein
MAVRLEKLKQYAKVLLPASLIEWVQNRSDKPYLEDCLRRIRSN